MMSGKMWRWEGLGPIDRCMKQRALLWQAVRNGTHKAKLQTPRLVPSGSPWPIISLVPKVLESPKQGHDDLEIKSTNTSARRDSGDSLHSHHSNDSK